METVLSYLLSRKARQLILMPKSLSICTCVCVYMSVTVSYGHLAHDLKIVSGAISMASSSTYLYNVLNSQFRLLPILRCTCGRQFGDQLRQVTAPVPVKILPVYRDAGQNGISYPERGPGNLSLVVAKALGSEKPFDCTIAECPCILY